MQLTLRQLACDPEGDAVASLLISALVTEHLSNSGAQPTSSLQLTTSSATLLSAKGNLDPRPYYLLRWFIASCKHYLIDQAFSGEVIEVFDSNIYLHDCLVPGQRPVSMLRPLFYQGYVECGFRV